MNINTIKKTVVLKAGEKFTLPPDSKLLTTTGVLTSTGCPVPIPENYECFGLTFDITSSDAQGSHSSPFNSTFAILGLFLNNQRYNFSTPITMNSGYGNVDDAFKAKIALDSNLVGSITNICTGNYTSEPGFWGTRYIISFKSLPSLMTSSFLIGQYGKDGDGANISEIYVPIQKRSNISVTQCPCSSN